MKLADYISKQGLTLEEFAALIGMSKSAVHRFVRGEAYPMPETAKKIVAVTNKKVKLDDLYGVE